MPAITNALTLEWVSYLDLEDLKGWLQQPTEDSPNDTKLEDILAMACEWVQTYLSRPIAPTQFTRRYSGSSGWSGAHIMLDYAPVLAITSVTEWRGSSGPFVLSEQTPDNQVDGYQLDPNTGTLTRVFAGLLPKPWFPGARNIEVDWVAGFNPLPRQIKIATLELAAYFYRNTQEAPRSFRPAAEYDGSSSQLWPAVPNRVTTLLQPFVQIGIG